MRLFIKNKKQRVGRAEGKKEGLEEGLQEGLKEGRREGIVETAKNLLLNEVEIEVIIKATGLSLKEIEKINNEL